VLPNGVLADSSKQDIRDWILRWARLKAVISLPQETFSPYGAGVKTSVIILEKRETVLSADGQLELGHEAIEVEEDYEVYMARIDDIGYDATGRFTVAEEETHFPPELSETVAYFNKLAGW
jgi:type I restriction enzyme M protein